MELQPTPFLFLFLFLFPLPPVCRIIERGSSNDYKVMIADGLDRKECTTVQVLPAGWTLLKRCRACSVRYSWLTYLTYK